MSHYHIIEHISEHGKTPREALNNPEITNIYGENYEELVRGLRGGLERLSSTAEKGWAEPLVTQAEDYLIKIDQAKQEEDTEKAGRIRARLVDTLTKLVDRNERESHSH